jgi:hypothetical protein
MPDDETVTKSPKPDTSRDQGIVEKRGGQTAPPNAPEPTQSSAIPSPPPRSVPAPAPEPPPATAAAEDQG